MAKPTIEEDKVFFIDTLKSCNGHSGNARLRNLLNWEDDRYWRTHSILLDEGLIVRGRGQGGSVAVVTIDPPVSADNAGIVIDSQYESRTDIDREISLYEPMKNAIETGWKQERGFDSAVVEITASQGRRNTGGTWTRPDLAVLAVKSYPYLPGRVFDIITFEVKKSDAVDVLGVFEALSHQQFASLSYVIFYTAGRDFEKDYSDTDRILVLAKLHGVGVIVAADAADPKKWEELVEPRRNIPDPAQANLFIASCFTEENKSLVVKWQK